MEKSDNNIVIIITILSFGTYCSFNVNVGHLLKNTSKDSQGIMMTTIKIANKTMLKITKVLGVNPINGKSLNIKPALPITSNRRKYIFEDDMCFLNRKKVIPQTNNNSNDTVNVLSILIITEYLFVLLSGDAQDYRGQLIYLFCFYVQIDRI